MIPDSLGASCSGRRAGELNYPRRLPWQEVSTSKAMATLSSLDDTCIERMKERELEARPCGVLSEAATTSLKQKHREKILGLGKAARRLLLTLKAVCHLCLGHCSAIAATC